MWRERRLPTHGATRASHFEFQQAFCSGRGAGRGEAGGRGGCGYGCPRLIFQMSKDRGHEAILLILDVAAVSPLGGRSAPFLLSSFFSSSFSFLCFRFPSLLLSSLFSPFAVVSFHLRSLFFPNVFKGFVEVVTIVIIIISRMKGNKRFFNRIPTCVRFESSIQKF